MLLVTIFLFLGLFVYHSQNYKNVAQKARYVNTSGTEKMEGNVVERHGKRLIVNVDKGRLAGEKIVLEVPEDVALGPHIAFEINMAQRQFRSFKNQHFDYDKYLYSKGITNVYRTDAVSLVHRGEMIRSIRFWMRERLESLIEAMPHSALMKTLILGEKNEYLRYGRFQKLGISHLLVISGLHFSIVYALVKKLTSFLRNHYIRSIVTILFMFVLYAVINESYSAMRALLTVLILELQMVRKKRADILVTQSICLIIILLAHPYAVLSTSLHLSFYTYILIAFGLKRFATAENKILALLQSSLYIQVASLPILIYYFGEINLYSMVANLLCVPIFGVLVPLALFGILCAPLPIVSSIVIWIWSFFVELLEFLVDFSPLQSLTVQITSFQLFAFCIALLLLRYVFRVLYDKKWMLGLCVLLLVTPIPQSPVEVVVPDVGHGDVTYIRVGGIVGVIDTGDGKMDVVSFLKSKGIKNLDYLVITHAHKDHVGGLEKLLKEIEVQKIYLTEQAMGKIKMEESLKAESEFVHVTSDLTQRFAKQNVQITLRLRRFFSESDENDNGITVEIDSKSFRCAVFGDASTHIIEALSLSGSYDFVKVGHHGSSTSTSKYVYGELDIAFLAVSHSTKYGNPNVELLEILAESNNRLYSTYYHGELIYDGRHVKTYLDANGEIISTYRKQK